MRKATLLFLLIGLLSSIAYASIEEELRKLGEETEASMTEEEKEGQEEHKREYCKKLAIESFKQDYREERRTTQALNEAQAEVDADFQRWHDILKINETTLYYTFSTIAQTLAGAFGILGAFTMYRLQSIKNVCSAIGDRVISSKLSTKPHLNKLLVPYSHARWRDLFNELDLHKKDNIKREEEIKEFPEKEKARIESKDWEYFYQCYTITPDELTQILHILKHNIDTKKLIKSNIYFSLRLTVFTIAISLLVLPFSGIISQSNMWTMAIISPILVLSIICHSHPIGIKYERVLLK